MRFPGTIQSWQGDRGFGFIEPAQWSTASLFALFAFLLVCLAVVAHIFEQEPTSSLD